MQFICQCTDFIQAADNILTDGQTTWKYGSFPRIFQELDEWFAVHGIRPEDCPAVACENSATSAVLLLYLLERGFGFFVLPATTQAAQDQEKAAALPAFCRQHIRTSPLAGSEDEAGFNPEARLSIAPNPSWHGLDAEPGDFGAARLFLKTSGSTGPPKMAVIPHAGLRGNARNTARRLRLSSRDRVALPVPLFHSYGLTTAFLSSIAAGAGIDLQPGANLLRFLKREQVFQPTVAFMTPIFCETLVKGRRGEPHVYRLTISAGDSFRGDLFSRYESMSGCLVNLYGSTEMGAVAAAGPDDPMEIRRQYVGRPMAGVSLRVGPGAESATEGPADQGSLWCRHPFGFEGYVDQDGRPVQSEAQAGWFPMQDLGRLSPEGWVQVLGRSDHSVNRDGLLVFFADIEEALRHVPGVAAGVVIASGEGSRGKRLVAFCVPERRAELSATDIRSACFSLLPRRAVPDMIQIINSLPQLPNGKIDRQKLKSLVKI